MSDFQLDYFKLNLAIAREAVQSDDSPARGRTSLDYLFHTGICLGLIYGHGCITLVSEDNIFEQIVIDGKLMEV